MHFIISIIYWNINNQYKYVCSGDRPGEGDADAQTGDEHDEEAKTKKFIAFSVIGGMLLLLALAVVLIGVVSVYFPY